MNDEVDINSIDEAIDAVAFLIEEDGKKPSEAITIVLEKFNVSKEDLLTAFETAFLCKPEEYQTICDEEINWVSNDIGSEIEILDQDDDLELDLASIIG